MKTLLISSALIAGAAHAELSMLPTPMQQGGMIHAMVTFLDQPTGSFSVHLEPGGPLMQPLQSWMPGETLNPADPWYSALDPSQADQPFNSQYGLMIDTGGSSLLPAGKSLGVRVTAIDAGLTGYLYRGTEGSEQFDPVFDEVGDAVLWSGVMWHPLFVADAPGDYQVSLEFFIADEEFGGVVSAASVLPDSAYSTGAVDLALTAVPEPASCALAAGTLCLAALFIRRRARR